LSAIYFAIPTDAGQAKIANALALGVPLKITHMAVGDGNGLPVTPNAAQTELIREKRRAPINTLFQDPTNQSQLVAEQIIPEDVGDWWIREAGIFSEDGTLIAVANTPDTYKPLLSSGAGRTQVIRIVLIVSDTSAVELKIDPAVVLATRKYVDDLMASELAKRDHKQSVRAATTATITLTGQQTIDGVALVAGDRVLVKNQADGKHNGIYLVAAQTWTRTTDADHGTELNAGARVYVEEGTVNGTRVWYLANAGAITIGTTQLQFKDEHPAATLTSAGILRLSTLAEALAGSLDNVGITPKSALEVAFSASPVGVPMPWPLAIPPTGFLLVNGQSFNPATYPKLAQAYPGGTLPDLRGEFIRGWDNGRGVDSGRGIVTWQDSETKEHNHSLIFDPGQTGLSTTSQAITTTMQTRGLLVNHNIFTIARPGNELVKTSHFGGVTTFSGGTETRSRNVAFNYIVRAA